MLMEGEVNFGAVNCEKNQQLCQHFAIQVFTSRLYLNNLFFLKKKPWNFKGYPTIRIFLNDGIDDFHGQHTSEALYNWVKMQLSNKLVQLTWENCWFLSFVYVFCFCCSFIGYFVLCIVQTWDVWRSSSEEPRNVARWFFRRSMVNFSLRLNKSQIWFIRWVFVLNWWRLRCGPCTALKPHLKKTANLLGKTSYCSIYANSYSTCLQRDGWMSVLWTAILIESSASSKASRTILSSNSLAPLIAMVANYRTTDCLVDWLIVEVVV